MRILLLLTALLVAGSGIAQSQVPPPSNGITRQPVQQNPASSQKPATEDQRGTEKIPLVIKSIPTEQTSQQAEENRKEREAKAANEWGLTFYTGLLAIFTFCLVLVGSFQIGLFVWQLRLMKKAAVDAGKSAEAALKTANSIETANRAFVKMSHLPPGLDFNAMGGAVVQMRVKNFGKTPARIVDVVFDFMCIADVASIPIDPPIIDNRSQGSAFLVEGDEFFLNRRHALGAPVMDELKGGNGTVLVWGHIDYIDAFEQRHRSGYGRIYNFTRDIERDGVSTEDFEQRSNLDHVPRTTYNYDRPYKEGDGQPA